MMIKTMLGILALLTATAPAFAAPDEPQPPEPIQITFDFGYSIDQGDAHPYEEYQGLSGQAIFVTPGSDGEYGLADLFYKDVYGMGYVAGSWVNPATTYSSFSATILGGKLAALSFATTGNGFTAALTDLQSPVVLSYDGASYQGSFTITGIDLATESSPAPEAATWAMMIGGFGMIGATLRRRRLAFA